MASNNEFQDLVALREQMEINSLMLRTYDQCRADEFDFVENNEDAEDAEDDEDAEDVERAGLAPRLTLEMRLFYQQRNDIFHIFNEEKIRRTFRFGREDILAIVGMFCVIIVIVIIQLASKIVYYRYPETTHAREIIAMC